MNSFNKTEAAVFSCRLCFLRAFPFISLMNTFRSLYSPCHEYISTWKNISITEKNTRCPHAPSTMSSSHQKEDWGHFQSTFGPTCRHASPPLPSQATRAKRLLRKGCMPLFPFARRAWDLDESALIKVEDLTIKWSQPVEKVVSTEQDPGPVCGNVYPRETNQANKHWQRPSHDQYKLKRC